MSELLLLGKRLFLFCLVLEVFFLAWQWFDFSSDLYDGSGLPKLLAAQQELVLGGMVETIIQKNIWDADRKPEKQVASRSLQGKPERVQQKVLWRLLALGRTKEGVQVAAIGLVANPVGLEYFRVGDELPDGATLLEIFKDGIQYADGDEIKKIHMFNRE